METYNNVVGALNITFSCVGVRCEFTTVNRGSLQLEKLAILLEYGFNLKIESPDSHEFDAFDKALNVFKKLWFEVDDRNAALIHYIITLL